MNNGTMNSVPKKPTNENSKIKERICIKCGKSQPSDTFAKNKDWKETYGRDCWCKECTSKIKTKEGIIEYFWDNNRKWKENTWARARALAEKNIITDPSFVSADTTKRQIMLEAATAERMFFLINSNGVYEFEQHNKSYAEAIRSGAIDGLEEEEEEKEYSPFFNGYFTSEDIAYLTQYYEHLEHDFDLDTENLRDYARKLAKASLLADKTQADYAAGKGELKSVNDALAQFDMLSKSANFAACKRKSTQDSAGVGSWAEITYLLETTGHTCTRKIEWPQDDVDKTIAEYRHIIESVGVDLE